MKPPPEFCYELQPGEDWVTFSDLLVIAHPDRPPKVVHVGGGIDLIEAKFDNGEAMMAYLNDRTSRS
jgi:hypothetical protein